MSYIASGTPFTADVHRRAAPICGTRCELLPASTIQLATDRSTGGPAPPLAYRHPWELFRGAGAVSKIRSCVSRPQIPLSLRSVCWPARRGQPPQASESLGSACTSCTEAQAGSPTGRVQNLPGSAETRRCARAPVAWTRVVPLPRGRRARSPPRLRPFRGRRSVPDPALAANGVGPAPGRAVGRPRGMGRSGVPADPAFEREKLTNCRTARNVLAYGRFDRRRASDEASASPPSPSSSSLR